MEKEKQIAQRLIEEGKMFILPEKINNWISYINSTNENLDSLHEISIALGIIALLDNGADMDFIIKSFEERECPMRPIVIRSLVANYSIRGPEFFEKTAKGPIPEGNIEHLEKLKRENARITFIRSMRDAGYEVKDLSEGTILVNGDFDNLFEDGESLKRTKTSD